MKFGVQTFTIRRAQKKSITDAYLPLINMGVRSFEVARIDFNEKNATELRRLASDHGIEISSIQVKPKYIFNTPRQIIEFCKLTGCKNAVISMLPFKCILGNDDKLYEFIDSLDAQYDLYAEQGITLAYHHHNWEYVRLPNGKSRMQEILTRTERIKFVHDTYWTARCGIEPAVQIRQFGERLLGIHLRDLTHERNGLNVIPHDTAIGEGVLDFERILRAAEDVGCSYYAIEQKTTDPYRNIEKSFGHLEQIKARILEKE